MHVNNYDTSLLDYHHIKLTTHCDLYKYLSNALVTPGIHDLRHSSVKITNLIPLVTQLKGFFEQVGYVGTCPPYNFVDLTDLFYQSGKQSIYNYVKHAWWDLLIINTDSCHEIYAELIERYQLDLLSNSTSIILISK